MSEQPITVSILPDGTVRFLVTDDTLPLVTGPIRRASHVEPVNMLLRVIFYAIRTRYADTSLMAAFTRLWPCLWRVNLSPVNGPILSTYYRNRHDAIKAEIAWLTVNFL